jgi:hypothetical protein
MPIPRTDLKEALQRLRDTSRDLLNTIDELTTDEAILAEYGKVDAAIGSVDGIISGEGQKTSFSEFLQNVGRSLVRAQEKLDEESGAYLKRLQSGDRDFVQPSVFRIPRMSAEMKFAFDKIDSKRVGLIFYRRTSQAREQHQQSLTFELATAPPPPETIARLRREAARLEVPSIDLILSPADRDVILSPLRNISPLGRPIDRARVLIWGAGGKSEYFLARAFVTDPAEKVGLWHLDLSGDEPILKVVVPFDPGIAPDTRAPLRAWVLRLAEAQARYLGAR